jgi:hypothetical protein
MPRRREGEAALDILGLGYNPPKIVELVNVCISENSKCRLQLRSCRTVRYGLVIFLFHLHFRFLI